jgi:mycobactin peptide synthetase MbtE
MLFQPALLESLRSNAPRTAIESETQSLSYQELLDRADKVTAQLLEYNLPKGTIIGILLQDRTDLITAIIGIANAGCIFVPIDGELPTKRLSVMAADLALHWVISSAHSPAKDLLAANPAPGQFLLEDILARESHSPGGTLPYPEFDAQDSLYIYFTSGSTGTPKGIIGKNDSLLQFLQWEIETFHIGKGTRISQLISPYFDAFLRDVFAPLLAGATLCIPPPTRAFLLSEYLVPWITRKKINLIHCVPSLFRVINSDTLTSTHFPELQYILLSGEKINPVELQKWYALFGARIQLVNLYGPTETTMIRTFYKIRPQDAKLTRIPIGKPIPGTEILVAGDDLEPCGPLVTGNLYIVTNYASRGYLNAPEQTAEKFLRLYPGTHRETIAFKTGDKARIMADGNLDLLGREDRQLKQRGVRIEPDGIEHLLLQLPYLRNAVVLPYHLENGDDCLLAFIVPVAGTTPAGQAAGLALTHLQEQLPDYMIPSRLIEVDDFPLLGNGKLDYKKLLNTVSEKPHTPPANATEEKIFRIWQDILGDAPLSTEDSFYSSGGNSISIMKLIGRLYKEFHTRISLEELFDNMSIRKQAAWIMNAAKEDNLQIPIAGIQQGYNLSAVQERLYSQYELHRESIAYNLPMAWELKAGADKEKIVSAIKALIARHESLRTEFRFIDGRLLQVVRDELVFEPDSSIGHTQDWREALAGFIRPFDLSKPPLLRCAIFSSPGKPDILMLDIHHIICDGMSQSILLADFIRLYQGLPLQALPLQYKDYAQWEHDYAATDNYRRHREFWLRQFEGDLPALELPTRSTDSGDGPAVLLSDAGGNLKFRIEKANVENLLLTLREEQVTAFSGLLTLFFIFLSRFTGQEDLVIGINTSGRLQNELNGLIGMFVKTLPIRYQLNLDLSFREFLRGFHRHLLQATANQLYDLADIQRELNTRSQTPVKSLFGVMFVFLEFETNNPRDDNPHFSRLEVNTDSAKYAISLFADESPTAFNFRLEYSTEYFTDDDARLIAGQFQRLIASIAEDPDAPGILPPEPALTAGRILEDTISFNF